MKHDIRRCSACKQELPVSAFASRAPNEQGKVYLRSECKECKNSQLRALPGRHKRWEDLTEDQKQKRRDYNRQYQAKQQELARLAKAAIKEGLIKVSA